MFQLNQSLVKKYNTLELVHKSWALKPKITNMCWLSPVLCWTLQLSYKFTVHAFSTRLFKTRFHWVLLTCETFSETSLCPNRIFNLLPELNQISLLSNFNMREIIFFLFDLCRNVKWYKYYSNKSDCFQIRIIVYVLVC